MLRGLEDDDEELEVRPLQRQRRAPAGITLEDISSVVTDALNRAREQATYRTAQSRPLQELQVVLERALKAPDHGEWGPAWQGERVAQRLEGVEGCRQVKNP